MQSASIRQDDKQAIRDSVDRWLEASKKGDAKTLLSLLADDVLFITPGKEPFGKEQFAEANEQQAQEMKMEPSIDIKEIEVAGDWAWTRSFLNVTFMQAGKTNKLSGHILTIWQKKSDGTWVIKRDANFVKPETDS
jgi:uncharacterized protein (TIGR02246 family)